MDSKMTSNKLFERAWTSTFMAAGLVAMIIGQSKITYAEGLHLPPLDSVRIHTIMLMLSEKPSVPGHPIADRTAWDVLANEPAYQTVLKRAEDILKKPLPGQPDDLFLEFSRNGNRSHWEKIAFERRERLTSLVLAECLENKGRYIPTIEHLITALCAERTWVFPAHDGRLANFNGTTIDIDLFRRHWDGIWPWQIIYWATDLNRRSGTNSGIT